MRQTRAPDTRAAHTRAPDARALHQRGTPLGTPLGDIAHFAYPLFAVPSGSDTVFHNMVVQVLTFGVCLATLILAMEAGDEKTLVATKMIHAFVLLASAVLTGVALALRDAKDIRLQRSVSLASFGIALTTVLLAVAILVARLETGTRWWLELVIAFTGVFWVWRTAQQVAHC